MTIVLSPQKVTRFLSKIIAFLIVADIAGLIARFYFHHEYAYGLVPLFDVDQENNIPSYFSSALLFFCFILLWTISWAHLNEKKSGYWYWAGLRLIFLFLAFDEAFCFHEQLIEPIRNALDASGIFYYAWVIPYSIFAIVVGVLYWRFWGTLPVPVRHTMVLAGAIYLTGALGFEFLAGSYSAAHKDAIDLPFLLLALCEESLEMVGTLIFIYALLDYIQKELSHASLTISFAPQKGS